MVCDNVSFFFFSLEPTVKHVFVSTQICLCLEQEQYQFLYDALEGVFPVQNGDVKAGQVSAVIEVVNETKAAEEKAEQPASSTPNGQQVAAETTPVADGEKENKKEEPEKVSSAPTETSSEDTSKGAILTVEVWEGWLGHDCVFYFWEISASAECF